MTARSAGSAILSARAFNARQVELAGPIVPSLGIRASWRKVAGFWPAWSNLNRFAFRSLASVAPEQGEIEMRKMPLAIVAIALLPNGFAFAAEPPDVVSCTRFVENGGMGEHADKAKAQTMCADPAYRAKALKAKASGK
jgi:hypothetical protein